MFEIWEPGNWSKCLWRQAFLNVHVKSELYWILASIKQETLWWSKEISYMYVPFLCSLKGHSKLFIENHLLCHGRRKLLTIKTHPHSPARRKCNWWTFHLRTFSSFLKLGSVTTNQHHHTKTTTTTAPKPQQNPHHRHTPWLLSGLATNLQLASCKHSILWCILPSLTIMIHPSPPSSSEF